MLKRFIVRNSAVKLILAVYFMLLSTMVSAQSEKILEGNVVQLLSYEGSPSIFFVLDNMPQSAMGCDTSKFIIEDSFSTPEKKFMYEKLMQAHNTKKAIAVNYDDALPCVENYISVVNVL
jgi:hypothetical protein